MHLQVLMHVTDWSRSVHPPVAAVQHLPRTLPSPTPEPQDEFDVDQVSSDQDLWRRHTSGQMPSPTAFLFSFLD